MWKILARQYAEQTFGPNEKPRDGAKQAMITKVQKGASHRDGNGPESWRVGDIFPLNILYTFKFLRAGVRLGSRIRADYLCHF
jgi:hypothetical protein